MKNFAAVCQQQNVFYFFVLSLFHILYCFYKKSTGSDGIVTRIPNGQIINQRVQNLSRTHTSTIRQTLSFPYEHIKQMPQLLKDIEIEIKEQCPKLIHDGSRTFRAIWTDYRHDHLEVVVEASFHIPPTSDEYHMNKQTMLQAIAHAVEKNHVEFALPTSICLSDEAKK
jgi:small-conductance mechanosensitive channel